MLQGPEKASLPPGPEIPTFGTVTFMLPAVFRPHLQTTPPGCEMCPAAEVTQRSECETGIWNQPLLGPEEVMPRLLLRFPICKWEQGPLVSIQGGDRCKCLT